MKFNSKRNVFYNRQQTVFFVWNLDSTYVRILTTRYYAIVFFFSSVKNRRSYRVFCYLKHNLQFECYSSFIPYLWFIFIYRMIDMWSFFDVILITRNWNWCVWVILLVVINQWRVNCCKKVKSNCFPLLRFCWPLHVCVR